MTTFLDALNGFLDTLAAGTLPLPPMSGTLDGHVPDLKGLPRDKGGIICALQDAGRLDGGDSAHRTGVAAFCNSAEDRALLPKFEAAGVMVRHPTQPPWNNPLNCSRDQLKGYSAGCWRTGHVDINARLLAAHMARGFTCQNIEEDEPGKPTTLKNPAVGDVLLPDDVMCLRITAGENAAFMDLVGQLALHVSIETASRDVKVDKGNLMLESIICGRLNLFVMVHQNYEDSIRYYWAHQGGQARMAEEVIWVVKQELKRYPKFNVPLLPANVLKLLRSLKLDAEFKNLDPQHRMQLAGRFLDAALKDAANTFVSTMKLSVDMAAQELKNLKATADQIAKALVDLKQSPDKITKALANLHEPEQAIRTALAAAGINPDQVEKSVQAALKPPAPPPIGGWHPPPPPALPPPPPPPWKWKL